MSPAEAAGVVRSMIAQTGEMVTIQRATGTNAAQTQFSIQVLAFVRPYDARESLTGIVQGDLAVTLSPDDLAAAGWPIGQGVGDAFVPNPTTDKIVAQGRTRKIIAALPHYIQGRPVKIDLQVRG